MTHALLRTMMLALVALALLGSAADAQRGRRSMGTHRGTFDKSSVETVEATVVDVDTTIHRDAAVKGTHLMVKTAKEKIAVLLGPTSYLKKQTVQFAAGDHVTITGSRITFRQSPAIVAMQIKKNGSVLTLRDSVGIPVWSMCAD